MDAEYKVVEDFQVKDCRVLALDRDCTRDAYVSKVYIDGKEYVHYPNSVQSWILLPGVHESFAGKTVVFKEK